MCFIFLLVSAKNYSWSRPAYDYSIGMYL